jgi:hypothetical protein
VSPWFSTHFGPVSISIPEFLKIKYPCCVKSSINTTFRKSRTARTGFSLVTFCGIVDGMIFLLSVPAFSKSSLGMTTANHTTLDLSHLNTTTMEIQSGLMICPTTAGLIWLSPSFWPTRQVHPLRIRILPQTSSFTGTALHSNPSIVMPRTLLWSQPAMPVAITSWVAQMGPIQCKTPCSSSRC